MSVNMMPTKSNTGITIDLSTKMEILSQCSCNLNVWNGTSQALCLDAILVFESILNVTVALLLGTDEQSLLVSRKF